LLTPEVITDLKSSGLMRVAFWLHGSSAASHDTYWLVPGSYRRTLEIITHCHEEQLPVQINTTLARRNRRDVEAMIELLTRLDITWWHVYLYVPTAQDEREEMLSAEEHEQVFAALYAASKRVHFQIKITEGQPYQRYRLQQQVRESRGHISLDDAIASASKPIDESTAFVFIDHAGEVHPSRFLPLSAGNVTRHSLPEICQDSSLFASLRDRSNLKGKCGQCPARCICGGSRARAWAMTGDLFAADPCCTYEP
jgi:radical SAM protein with 4Fe4S-binding SPASM domain